MSRTGVGEAGEAGAVTPTGLCPHLRLPPGAGGAEAGGWLG